LSDKLNKIKWCWELPDKNERTRGDRPKLAKKVSGMKHEMKKSYVKIENFFF